MVSKSGREDVDHAVKVAREAHEGWRLTPAPRRGEILFRAAEILLKNKEALGKIVTREMGKVLPEGLGDVQEAIDMGYYMAGEGRRPEAEEVPWIPTVGGRSSIGISAVSFRRLRSTNRRME